MRRTFLLDLPSFREVEITVDEAGFYFKYTDGQVYVYSEDLAPILIAVGACRADLCRKLEEVQGD